MFGIATSDVRNALRIQPFSWLRRLGVSSVVTCDDRSMSRRDLVHVLGALWDLSSGDSTVGVGGWRLTPQGVAWMQQDRELSGGREPRVAHFLDAQAV